MGSAVGWGLVALASAGGAWMAWQHLGGAPNPGLGIAAFLERGQISHVSLLGLGTPPILFVGLRLARVLERQTWMVLWATVAPWPLLGVIWVLEPAYLIGAWLLRWRGRGSASGRSCPASPSGYTAPAGPLPAISARCWYAAIA